MTGVILLHPVILAYVYSRSVLCCQIPASFIMYPTG